MLSASIIWKNWPYFSYNQGQCQGYRGKHRLKLSGSCVTGMGVNIHIYYFWCLKIQHYSLKNTCVDKVDTITYLQKIKIKNKTNYGLGPHDL